MRKFIFIGILLSSSLTTRAAGSTNIMATRIWVSNYFAGLGLTNNASVTNLVNNTITSSNRVIASCNWFTGTNYNNFNTAPISNLSAGLYRLTLTNNLGVDFVQRTNGTPQITASFSTNVGCSVGLFMVTSNIIDFYTRTNTILVTPESIQVQVTR